jgi:regulation of enolase protein 1 (concanavalin A-like superfamily)
VRKALQYLEGREEKWWQIWETVVYVAALLRAVGDPEPALRLLEEVALGLRRLTLQLHSTYRYHRALVHCLCQLEPAFADPEAFRAFCRRIQAAHPEINHGPFTHWFLEPAQPRGVLRIPYFVWPTTEYGIRDTQHALLDAGWVWHDPFGDCSWTVADGLVLQAANERDLELVNQSAPRLVRPISGEFTAMAVCEPATPEKPAIGGLLLWQDAANYVRLDRGTRGPHEIAFQGCLENADMMLGRGCLPAERIWLRLERSGDRVSAFCSPDGEDWFTVGSVAFPIAGPLEVGVHAIGRINRSYGLINVAHTPS